MAASGAGGGRSRQPSAPKRAKVAAGRKRVGATTTKPARVPKAPARKGPRIKPTPEHAAELFRRLRADYPDAHCELDHRSPFELLVATILSAQCTDKRVNMVTPVLFERYPTPEALAAARPEDIEDIIRSTGFFRAKTKSLLGMAGAVVDRHGGAIPPAMDALVRLPGVGRKTANVVLGNAFGIDEGVVVDTHVARVAARLGLTRQADPVKIEQDLVKLFPRETWTLLSHLLIWHGRRVCDARKPRCDACSLRELCPSSRV